MTIIDTLKKYLNKKREQGLTEPTHEKITADEMELESYKKEERRDALRKELAWYRLKKNREIIIGNTFVDQAREIHGSGTILDAEDVFNKKIDLFSGKNTILGGDNMFKGKKRKKFKETSMWR